MIRIQKHLISATVLTLVVSVFSPCSSNVTNYILTALVSSTLRRNSTVQEIQERSSENMIDLCIWYKIVNWECWLVKTAKQKHFFKWMKFSWQLLMCDCAPYPLFFKKFIKRCKLALFLLSSRLLHKTNTKKGNPEMKDILGFLVVVQTVL